MKSESDYFSLCNVCAYKSCPEAHGSQWPYLGVGLVHLGDGDGEGLEAEAVAEGGDAGGEALEQALLAAALEERVVEDEAGEQRVEFADVLGPREAVGPVAQAAEVALVQLGARGSRMSLRMNDFAQIGVNF